jgi:hypothetical protein
MLRKLFLYVGCLVVGTAAAWASFGTLAHLAAATGWTSGDWLLPTSIDALGAMSCWVWLTPAYSTAARAFARRTTFAVILVSVIGNGVGHLVTSGRIDAGVLMIVLVGSVPPASLAAVIHLLVLVTSVPVPDAAPVPAEKTETEAGPKPPAKKTAPKKTAAKSVPKPVLDSGPEVDDLLMQKARHVAEQYEAEHGKAPSRDDLKTALGVGTMKATVVAAALKKEREAA